MERGLPLLALRTSDSKRSGSALDSLSDNLKALILTAMKTPYSICKMVQAWASVRKIQEGGDLWRMVYVGMKVPKMFYPHRYPTKQTLEALCKQIGTLADLNELLLRAAGQDNVDGLLWVLSLGANNYRSAFKRAAQNGSVKSLPILWEYRNATVLFLSSSEGFGWRENGIWRNWLTPAVREASLRGHIKCLEFMLRVAAEETPMHLQAVYNDAASYAAQRGHIDTVRWLAERPDYSIDWDAVAMCSARENNIVLMQLCAQKGANEWWRVLSDAAKYDHIEAMAFASKQGVGDAQEAFESAAVFGKLRALEWLSDHYQPDWQEVLEQAEIFDDHVDVIEFINGKIQES